MPPKKQTRFKPKHRIEENEDMYERVKRADAIIDETARGFKKSSTSLGRLTRWLNGLRSPKKLLIATIVTTVAITVLSKRGRGDIQRISEDVAYLLRLYLYEWPRAALTKTRNVFHELRMLHEGEKSIFGVVYKILCILLGENSESTREFMQTVAGLWEKTGIDPEALFQQYKEYTRAPKIQLNTKNAIRAPNGGYKSKQEFLAQWIPALQNFYYTMGKHEYRGKEATQMTDNAVRKITNLFKEGLKQFPS